ncbi:hypothetical protein GCM10027088_06890 [Nocardia goodfellowii]
MKRPDPDKPLTYDEALRVARELAQNAEASFPTPTRSSKTPATAVDSLSWRPSPPTAANGTATSW